MFAYSHANLAHARGSCSSRSNGTAPTCASFAQQSFNRLLVPIQPLSTWRLVGGKSDTGTYTSRYRRCLSYSFLYLSSSTYLYSTYSTNRMITHAITLFIYYSTHIFTNHIYSSHITISPYHYITISPYHYITTSLHHHITISPYHHITIYLTDGAISPQWSTVSA